jgi:hypothetical protein
MECGFVDTIDSDAVVVATTFVKCRLTQIIFRLNQHEIGAYRHDRDRQKHVHASFCCDEVW